MKDKKTVEYHKLKTSAEVCLTSGYASMSLICRSLNVSYQEALPIMDELERLKIVGSFNGSKNREVLIKSVSDLENLIFPF